jgi:hypothetical protein
MQITNKAISEIKSSNKLMGRLMAAFDRGQRSMEKWLESKDIRLTTPTAVLIIKEETGLDDSQILEEEVKEGTVTQ